MDDVDLNRRDFHRLTMAAFGGAVAGATFGCAKSEPETELVPKNEPAATSTAAAEENLLLVEPHVCRGLNTCKGKDKEGDNACAGQGTCATAKVHSCSGQNECKGQGGCGSNPGQNACKGQGGCSVPLMETAWQEARKNFEAAMQAAGKEFGQAPPIPE